MLLVASGWEGIWAALAGGLVSGVTVVAGVYLAQHLSNRQKALADQRAAADRLLVEVGNLRDAAVHSRSKSPSGRYDMWPLRHQIYLSHALHGLPVMEGVRNYYAAVHDLRQFARSSRDVRDLLAGGVPVDSIVVQYKAEIDQWADALIEALSAGVRSALPVTVTEGPVLPELPQ